MKEVHLYTDGACFHNPGAGGWGVVLVYGERKRELSGGESKTTKNKMELQAVIEGLRALKQPCRVSVYSDSQYVVNAFNKNWFVGWERRGWKTSNGKPVRNKELWEQLWTEVEDHDVTWSWVEGHAGNFYNERAHSLAVAACAAVRNQTD